MKIRLIPKDGVNPYAAHPGFVARGCELQTTVTPAYHSTSMYGFGCHFNGGHCLPGDYCDKRRESVALHDSIGAAIGGAK